MMVLGSTIEREGRASCRVDTRSELNHTRGVDVGDESLLSPVSGSGISRASGLAWEKTHCCSEMLRSQTIRLCFSNKECIESDSSFVLHEILQYNADDHLLAFGKVEAIEAVADRQIAALQVSCETSQIPVQFQF